MLVLVASVLSHSTPAATAARPAPEATPGGPACAATDPFTAELATLVDRQWAGHHLTAAVYDERDGCLYLFAPGERHGTASIVKVEIYAGVLLRAQREGRWLTPYEQVQVWPMITESANLPATEMWWSLGGRAGQYERERTFDMTQTVLPSTPAWGRTWTSALDQVRLLRQAVVGAYGPLQPVYRQALLTAMRAVVPWQRWGVTAGVPPTYSVGLKNGWAPLSLCYGCAWTVSSMGWIADPRGGGYSVAILSDGWRDVPEGIPAVEWVSRVIADRLGRAPYGPFASRHDFVARQYADLFGRGPDLPSALFVAHASGWSSAGAGPVLEAMLASRESGGGDAVARAYAAVLGRRPDPGGLRAWRGEVRRGFSELDLFRALAASPEFGAATGGLADDAFVRFAYQRVLGRPPEPSAAAYWQGQLRTLSRADLMYVLAASGEGQGRLVRPSVVTQVYDALLGRLPGPDELGYWVTRPGFTRASLASAVLHSPEYVDRLSE